MGEPSAGLGGGKKVRKRGVYRRRLLAGNRMPRARNDQQAGRRHCALEKDRSVETGVIFIADDDQQRDREALQILL